MARARRPEHVPPRSGELGREKHEGPRRDGAALYREELAD